MYNWSVDTRTLEKNPQEFEQFTLEQQINFGLNDTKLSREALVKFWDVLDIDVQKRIFLKKLVWPQS